MATDLSTATAVPQPAPYQHHAYRKSTTYTPLGSGANTPMNVSPTSPRNTSHLPQYVPQIRPPKNPIYVPAALRRTEKPTRPSPPKIDSAVDSPNGSWNSGIGFGPSPGDAATPVARVGNEDLNSIYNEMPMSPITGPITRNHWQPDNSTSVCTASACQTPFGIFVRRHHCRKCGGIFCWQHAQERVRLNEHALFHSEGEWQRACDRCFTQYREWEQLRTSRQNSESSGSTTAVQIDTPTAVKRPENNRVGSIANSFSGTWNWSTF